GIIAFTRIHLVSLSCEDTQPWFVFPRLVSSSVHPPSGVLNEIDQYYIASLWYSKSYGVFFPFPVYSCALLRDILLQGRLYISRNWLCFYANLFGKDIKYVFVSLLSRDSVYDVLRRICTHLQVNGKKSLSLKQYLEEPGSLSMDEFPVVNDFPPVLKWRKKPSIPSVSSSLPDLLGNSTSSRSAVDIPYLPTEVPLTLKGKIRGQPPSIINHIKGQQLIISLMANYYFG
uniref:GRAM domain-containing protein n=1 Tax=Hucho hucho TaxID=62062 RepID=A0A4W5PP56_9TELE